MGRGWRAVQHEDGARAGEARADERLVEGLRLRAPEALATLHEEYAAGIYSLALRVVRHRSDAEDITQDVLIRAFERLPRDREVLLRPWLYRLTLNRCYDHLRVAARRPLAAQPAQEPPAPHDPYEQSELQGLLEASLADLTRRQRAALLLKDVHGLTLVEVAACLDLTPGSVEVLLARARRAFRASFERRCTAAGRPVPRSAGVLVALPLLPLPAALGTPPLAALGTPSLALPAALLPLAPAAGAPLTAATGVGALLGLPATVKTAVLVAAAAASLGSAELVATRADHRPPRAPAAAAAVASGGGGAQAVVAHTRTATAGSPRPSPASAAPSPPAVDVTASPSPLGSPAAAPTPVATPLGSASPSPTPDARATTPGSPSPAPTAPPTAEPSPSPSPGASSSPDASPAPSPGP